MSVHYKFKSSREIDTITFDGLHISVGDLKKAIINKKRQGHVWKSTEFDLQVINAQTKEEYVDNNTLIPKNTSLIIARVPLTAQQQIKAQQWNQANSGLNDHHHDKMSSSGSDGIRRELDLSQMSGSEEDKIQAMISQSTIDYDPNKYQKIRGQSQVGEVPLSYRCFKCHKSGHWIKNCPLNNSSDSVHGVEQHKRVSGIPKSFLQERANNSSGNEKNDIQLPAELPEKEDIPEDLICSICKDLFSDAVMIPCCGSSFCDECVRTALLESEDNECPDCKEKGSSPGSLIPNRFLRNSVNNFKNRTGYVKFQQKPQNTKETEKSNPISIAINKENVNKIVENTTIKQKVEDKKISTDKITKTETSDQSLKKEDHKSNLENSNDYKNNTAKDEKPLAVSQNPEVKDKDVDSDYEDNIVVTISPRNKDNRTVLQERRQNEGVTSKSPPNEGKSLESFEQYQQHPYDSNGPIQKIQSINSTDNILDPYTKSTAVTGYLKTTGMSEVCTNIPQPRHPMAPQGPYEMNNFNRMPHLRGYMYGDRRPMHPGSYGPGMHPRHMNAGMNHGQRYMGPSSNLMSVYQGVANKVGTGIIDDPLEAFNRIMREKEKRKEKERRRSIERNRSIERYRSRSPDRFPSRKVSPFNRRPMRNRTPEYKKERPLSRERDRDRRAHMFRESDRDRDRDRDRERDKDRDRERDKDRDRDRDRDRERDRGGDRERERDRDRDRRENFKERKSVDDFNRERDKRNIDYFDRRDDFRDRKVEEYRKDRIDDKRRKRSRSNSFSDRSIKNTPEKRFDRNNSPPSGRFDPRGRVSPPRFSPRHSPLHIRSPEPIRHSPPRSRNISPSISRMSTVVHNRHSPLPISRLTPTRTRHSPVPHDSHISPPYPRHSPGPHYDSKDIMQHYDDAPPGTIEPPPPGFEFSSNKRYDMWSPNEFNNSQNNKKDFYNEDPFDMFFPPKESFDDESDALYGDLNPKNDEISFDEAKNSRARSIDRRSHSQDSLLFKNRSRSRSLSRTRPRSHSLHKTYRNEKEIENRGKSIQKHNSDKDKSAKHHHSHESKKEVSEHLSPRLDLIDDDKSSRSREKISKSKISKTEKYSDSEGKKNKKLKKESRKKKKEKEDKEKKHRKKSKDKKENKHKSHHKISSKESNKTNTPPKTTSEEENDYSLNAVKENTVDEEKMRSTSPMHHEQFEQQSVKAVENSEEVKSRASSAGEESDATEENFESVGKHNDKGEIDYNASAESGEIIDDNIENATVTSLPEPSKWELDDDVIQDLTENDGDNKHMQSQNNFEDKLKLQNVKVTSEVIKRAENAIFTRTVSSSIRPIEVKRTVSNDSDDFMEKSSESQIKSFTIKHKSIKDRLGPLINFNTSNVTTNSNVTVPSMPTVIASSIDRGNSNKSYLIGGEVHNSSSRSSNTNKSKDLNSNRNYQYRENRKSRSRSHDRSRKSTIRRSRSRDDRDRNQSSQQKRHYQQNQNTSNSTRIRSRSRSKDKSINRRNSFDRRHDRKDIKSFDNINITSTNRINLLHNRKRDRSPSSDYVSKKVDKKTKQDIQHDHRHHHHHHRHGHSHTTVQNRNQNLTPSRSRSRSRKKRSKSKTEKSQPSLKKSRKNSSSVIGTTSSSDGDTYSESEGERHKNKKDKHKHTEKEVKNKDTSRRSSSVESKKSSKSKKKKKKSSKKKKKSKE